MTHKETSMKRPTEHYLWKARNLVAQWVEEGYPGTISVTTVADLDDPWPLLVCRVAPQSATHQRESGSSFTVFPEVHFWFPDGRLGIARARPVGYEMTGNDTANPAEYAAQNLLTQWIDDEYPCCSVYSAGGWTGKVYAHEDEEEGVVGSLQQNSNLFPRVLLHSPAVRDDATHDITFRPTEYEVWWVGTLRPEADLKHYR